jgi:hypothetical protein
MLVYACLYSLRRRPVVANAARRRTLDFATKRTLTMSRLNTPRFWQAPRRPSHGNCRVGAAAASAKLWDLGRKIEFRGIRAQKSPCPAVPEPKIVEQTSSDRHEFWSFCGRHADQNPGSVSSRRAAVLRPGSRFHHGLTISRISFNNKRFPSRQRSFNWQSTAFVMRGLSVRLRPLALQTRLAGGAPQGLPRGVVGRQPSSTTPGEDFGRATQIPHCGARIDGSSC